MENHLLPSSQVSPKMLHGGDSLIGGEPERALQESAEPLEALASSILAGM